MIITTLILLLFHLMDHFDSCILSATVIAWVSGKKVAMTDMHLWLHIYNVGMGGGSAAFGAMGV
jgi:NAD(P) transhydrogenase subunit beta